jgi:ectoine hydroxylase-related dioxygenase (phytanoyl-CoA dioxygenase family)
LNYKQPLTEQVVGIDIHERDDRFPIHNDWAYYAMQQYPQSILSSAITLDDCTPDNGPLHVWPGSHKTHLEHTGGEYGLQVKPGLIDPDGGIDMLAPAGSVMLFHSLLVHNSRPNHTNLPRRLMIYSHYPATFNMGFDIRSGPTRLMESPWEMEYIRLKASGQYVDRFHI